MTSTFISGAGGRSQNGRCGDPGLIRTADLRFRKPLLYPSELRGHVPAHLAPSILTWNPPAPIRVEIEAGPLKKSILIDSTGNPVKPLAEKYFATPSFQTKESASQFAYYFSQKCTLNLAHKSNQDRASTDREHPSSLSVVHCSLCTVHCSLRTVGGLGAPPHPPICRNSLKAGEAKPPCVMRLTQLARAPFTRSLNIFMPEGAKKIVKNGCETVNPSQPAC